MPVKMGVSNEQMEAPQPVPANWYDLKITGITVKASSKKDSYNYTVATQVVGTNNPEWDYKKKISILLNTKMGSRFADVIHGAGLEDADVIGDNACWTFDQADPENVEKAQYKGPLLGKILHAEVAVRTYNGNENNAVKQIQCKVKDCKVKFPKIRHTTDMIGKN